MVLGDFRPSINPDSIRKLFSMSVFDGYELYDYLLEEPELLRKDVISHIRFIAQSPSLAVHAQDRTLATDHANLLEYCWQLLVMYPFVADTTNRRSIDFLDLTRKYAVYDIVSLVELVERRPDTYQQLLVASLRGSNKLDWMLLSLFTCVASMSLSETFLIEIFNELIEYESILQLETIAERSQHQMPEAFCDVVNKSLEFIRDYRDSGILPGDGRVHLRLGQFLNAESWSESFEILRRNEETLLTEVGLQEMEQLVDSAVIQSLLEGDSISVVGKVMYHFYIFMECRQYGIERTAANNSLPSIPAPLWTIGGMLYASRPRIDSWEVYQRLFEAGDEYLRLLAEYLEFILPSQGASVDVRSQIRNESNFDLVALTRYVFVYFLFTKPPRLLLDTLLSLSVTPSLIDIGTLNDLIELEAQQGIEGSVSSIRCLRIVIASPFRTELVALLDVVSQDGLEPIARNGAALARVAGSLAVLLETETAIDLGAAVSALDEDLARSLITLINLSGGRFFETTWNGRLEAITLQLRALVELGIHAFRTHLMIQKIGLAESSTAVAVLVWSAANTKSQIASVIDRHPALIQDEVIEFIKNFIVSSGVNDAARLWSRLQSEKPEEVIADELVAVGESASHETPMEMLEVHLHVLRYKYADLLDIRRIRLEAEAGFVRNTATSTDAVRASELILRLESSLAAGIWVPVSRVDLTDTFFAVLTRWRTSIREAMGGVYARFIDLVSEQAYTWKEMLPRRAECHTFELSENLRQLVQVFDVEFSNSMQEYVENHPEVVCTEALEILYDWGVTSRGLVSSQLDDLEAIQAWMRVTIRLGDPKLACKLLFDDSMRDIVFGTPDDSSRSHDFRAVDDLIESFLQLEPDEVTARIQALISRLVTAQTAKGELLPAQRHDLHVAMYRTQLASGTLKIDERMLRTTLVRDPALRDALRIINDVSVHEWIDLATIASEDPLIEKLLDQRIDELSEANLIELDKLTGEIGAVVIVDNWVIRLMFLRNSPWICTDRGWAILQLRKPLFLEFISQEIDRVKAEMQYEEVCSFIQRSRLASFAIAQEELITSRLGEQGLGSVNVSGYMELLQKLPFSLIEKISVPSISPYDYAEYLYSVDKELDLSTALCATREQLIGVSFKSHHETTGAVDSLDRAIDAFKRSVELTDDSDVLMKSLRSVQLGDSLRIRFEEYSTDSSDIDHAIRYLLQATRYNVADANIIGQCYGFLGTALHVKYEATNSPSLLNDAFDALKVAIETTPASHQDWVGWHINLAGVCRDMYERDRIPDHLHMAVSLLQQAVDLVPEGHRVWWTSKLNLLGNLVAAGRIDEAISGYMQILEIDGAEDHLEGLYQYTAKAFSARFRQSGNPYDLLRAAELYRHLCNRSRVDTKMWVIATANLTQLLRVLAGILGSSNPQILVEFLVRQDKVLRSPAIELWPSLFLVHAQEAARYFIEVDLVDNAIDSYCTSIRSLNIMWASTRVIDDKLDLIPEYRETSERTALLCLMKNDIQRAYEFLLRLKEKIDINLLRVIPLSQLLENPSNSSVEMRALISESLILEQKKTNIRARMFGESVTGNGGADRSDEDYSMLLEELQQLESRHSQVWRRLQKQSLMLNSLVGQPSGVSNFSSIRATALARLLNAIIVDFFEVKGGWIAFVISRDATYFKPLVTSDVEMPWQRWQKTISRMGEDDEQHEEIRATLMELYGYFIRPIESCLADNISNLILSTSGQLGSLPMGSIQLSDGQLLGEKYAVRYTSSVSALGRALRRGSGALADIVVTGYAGQRGSSHFLKYISTEISSIALAARGKSIRVLAANDATAKNVIDGVARHDIAHFACHGVVLPSNPSGSGLVLANGEWLTVPLIMHRIGLRPGSLVVLAACDTGRDQSSDIAHSEYSSIVRAFLYAGALGVVSSLWKVDDLSTSVLMAKFYGFIFGEGLEPHLALREAQAWLRTASVAHILELFRQGKLGNSDETIEAVRTLTRLDKGISPYSKHYHWASFIYTGV